MSATSSSGHVVAVCTSAQKGRVKTAVERVEAVRGLGLRGDAHAGSWHRQVSLLAEEQIARMRARGLELAPGAFGENLVTAGVDLDAFELGRRFRVGDEVVLQATQHGKECHDRCAIYTRTGDCIMPRHGLFARVVRGGVLAAGQALRTDPELDRVRYAVLTLSDRSAAGAREDASGTLVCELVEAALRAGLVGRRVLPDEQQPIAAELVRLCDEELCDLILTTGGTGLAPRDVTPEATLQVIERQIPGMAEAVRAAGLAHTPRAMLSRAVCGLRGGTIIVNLSGSPRAVREQLGVLLPVLPHAIQTVSGLPQDCGREVRP